MYHLSHPCILSMELTKFGTMANELAEYYINFLKGLSRKIDFNTIHIFFNKVILLVWSVILTFLYCFRPFAFLITLKTSSEQHAEISFCQCSNFLLLKTRLKNSLKPHKSLYKNKKICNAKIKPNCYSKSSILFTIILHRSRFVCIMFMNQILLKSIGRFWIWF